MDLRRETPVQYLKGVGPKLGELFARHGVRTIADLLEFYPRAYEDRRAARQIASLQEGDVVSLRARVVSVSSINLGKSSRKMYDVLLQDSSGRIHCKYFRVPYKGYFERFTPHKEVRIVGKVIRYRGKLEFHHPDIRDDEPLEDLDDVLVPLYVEIEGLPTGKIQKLIVQALESLQDTKEDERLPLWLREKWNLIERTQALRKIHQPEPELARNYFELKSAAHRRLIFEEFFWLELYLAAKKTGFKRESAPVLKAESELEKKVLTQIPFSLTNAQKRALVEIDEDLQSGSAMHRLVQGDVGSGKTLVSFLAAVRAVAAKKQGAIMAPTEILAEQHWRQAQKFLVPAGVRVGLLTGSTKVAARREILEQLAAGEIDFLIGTHALIESDVVFHDLALVVIDEQHRFGVEQRGRLRAKGGHPHFLVMTATPIPRTLAMTVYGDLDVSVIDELPPGRTPIQTRVIFESKRQQALDFMYQQVKKGRQAYVVYPLVAESEKIDLKDAISQFDQLKKKFPDLRWSLLHGQMKAAEKEQVMNQFRQGQSDILVSTTVIEVGVDVPNATVMMIEQAERFGLSQLHQLRGRVGRGHEKSFCILVMGYAVSEEGRARTEFMEKSTDGFKIAEFDLEMRGPGEFLGTRQSGLPGFKLANIVRDSQILMEARRAAFAVLEQDPALKQPEHRALREELLRTHGPTALASIG